MASISSPRELNVWPQARQREPNTELLRGPTYLLHVLQITLYASTMPFVDSPARIDGTPGTKGKICALTDLACFPNHGAVSICHKTRLKRHSNTLPSDEWTVGIPDDDDIIHAVGALKHACQLPLIACHSRESITATSRSVSTHRKLMAHLAHTSYHLWGSSF